jgi:hypothetical protein
MNPSGFSNSPESGSPVSECRKNPRRRNVSIVLSVIAKRLSTTGGQSNSAFHARQRKKSSAGKNFRARRASSTRSDHDHWIERRRERRRDERHESIVSDATARSMARVIAHNDTRECACSSLVRTLVEHLGGAWVRNLVDPPVHTRSSVGVHLAERRYAPPRCSCVVLISPLDRPSPRWYDRPPWRSPTRQLPVG